MKRTFVLALAAALAASGAASDAFAADYNCNATISQILIYSDGYVVVNHSGRGALTFLCSLQVEWKGVKPSTCAMWVSSLQSQKRAGEQANFYYSTSDGSTSCANMLAGSSSPPPFYIGIFD